MAVNPPDPVLRVVGGGAAVDVGRGRGAVVDGWRFPLEGGAGAAVVVGATVTTVVVAAVVVGGGLVGSGALVAGGAAVVAGGPSTAVVSAGVRPLSGAAEAHAASPTTVASSPARWPHRRSTDRAWGRTPEP